MFPVLNRSSKKHGNAALMRPKAAQFLISISKMHLDQVAQLNVCLLRFKKLLRKSVVTAMAEKRALSNLFLTPILAPELYSESLGRRISVKLSLFISLAFQHR